MTRRGAALAAAALAASLAARPSRAGAEDEAALAQGIQLRKELRDEEALDAFQRSYALRPTPKARAQIALAEQALGRWLPAERDLQEALGHADDAWIAANRDALDEAGREISRHLATVEIASNVAGASIRVDGEAVGVAPCSVRVQAGTIFLDAEAPGHETARRRIEVGGGTVAREQIDLVALVPPAPPVPRAEPARPERPPPTPGPAVADRPPWMWIAFGGAAAALGVGVTAHVVREERAATWNDATSCPPGSKAAVCGGVRDAVDTLTVVAVAGYSAAAVLTGIGVYLALPRHAAAVSGWVAPGVVGARLGVAF
jgi:hypothetical protein